MANYEGRVASGGVIIPKNKVIPLQSYINQYTFGELNWFFESKQSGTEVGIYGYSGLWCAKRNDDDCDSSLDEFLEGLRKFIPERARLQIMEVGGEKCRWPLSAYLVTITRRRVTWKHLI